MEENIMAVKLKKDFYVTYNLYFGFCVKSNTSERILFAGTIEDCNRKCVQLNS